MSNKGQSKYTQELLNKISQLKNDYDKQGMELVELQTVAGSQIEMFAKVKQLQAELKRVARKIYGWCKKCDNSLVVGIPEHKCDKCGSERLVFDVETELVRLRSELAKKAELIFAYDQTHTPIIDRTIIDLRAELAKYKQAEISRVPWLHDLFSDLQEEYMELRAELDKHRKRIGVLTQECLVVETDLSNSYVEINRLKAELKGYRWRDVKEELPGDSADVLVSTYQGFVFIDCYINKHGGYWERKNTAGMITHWMPIPKREQEASDV
jgi:chromosome segregation ATPase